MKLNDIVCIGAARTATGSFGGTLRDLAACVLRIGGVLHGAGELAEAHRSYARALALSEDLVAADPAAHDRFWARVDAPFVGNGFTRWVDGQYALDAPELGLSNWEGGRMLGRGILHRLGDGLGGTVRHRVGTGRDKEN